MRFNKVIASQLTFFHCSAVSLYNVLEVSKGIFFLSMSTNQQRTIYVGGLADEVTEEILNDVFLPFGDILNVQIPIDYETEKHRRFAFIEFEVAENVAEAIDNMNESELFGRTIRVNLPELQRIKESSTRRGWADEHDYRSMLGRRRRVGNRSC